MRGRDDGALGGGAEERRIFPGDVLLMSKYGGEYRITSLVWTSGHREVGLVVGGDLPQKAA